MNRKEFLSTMAMLGAASVMPSSLLKTSELAAAPKKDKRKIDPSKLVLMADIHICGEFENGKPFKYPYNPTSLKLRIDEIFAMRPLPATVVIFGDVAWDYGLEEDYKYAAELLQPLKDAGINVVLGLGNHDRREAFFNVFPEYAKSTPVPGRAVSIVSLPEVDLVVLDSLAELPNLKRKQKTTVTGELDEAQLEWLKSYLAEAKRPVILGAHHPHTDMPNLTKLLSESPAVVAYLYGHKHIWNKSVSILRPKAPQRMIPIVGLPATFYGDIGLAQMTVDAKGATIEYSSKGFWWPQPVENPPKEWFQRQEDLSYEKCRILF